MQDAGAGGSGGLLPLDAQLRQLQMRSGAAAVAVVAPAGSAAAESKATKPTAATGGESCPAYAPFKRVEHSCPRASFCTERQWSSLRRDHWLGHARVVCCV